MSFRALLVKLGFCFQEPGEWRSHEFQCYH
jgi:hypothetical protein